LNGISLLADEYLLIRRSISPHTTFLNLQVVFCQPKSHILIMSKLVTKKHSYADILKGFMAQTQNKNQKNPTHAKPVPATVLPNNLGHRHGGCTLQI
jgi:hypothetical protein